MRLARAATSGTRVCYKDLLKIRVRNLSRDAVLATEAEVADTSKKRRIGLRKHQSLAPGEGMWISPCEAIHTIGMKFAIDVLFLSRTREVVKLKEAVPPGRIAVCLRAHSVLELPAGTIASTGTQVGDRLQFERVP